MCRRSVGRDAPRQSDTRSCFNIKFNQFGIRSIDTSATSLTVHWQSRTTSNKNCAQLGILLDLTFVLCTNCSIRLLHGFSTSQQLLQCSVHNGGIKIQMSYVHTHNRFNMFCVDERV